MLDSKIVIPPPMRWDCMARWMMIREHIWPLDKKCLLDIGCSNGYFSAQFLADGGKLAIGVESNPEIRRESMQIDSPRFKVYESIDEISGEYDVCLFLDLQYHEKIDYLEFCKSHAKVSFISASGDAKRNNERLKQDLQSIFNKVSEVGNTPYAGRMIYKCE